ncbi:MAG: L,D-transpeptidase [Clostridia bacterium]|nr:L,D-transpeptidase [Clostridia bacterium]
MKKYRMLSLAVALMLSMPALAFSEETQPYYPTPAARSTVSAAHDPEGCYWCTPMDITDEEAVWAMLTAPMAVIDVGQKNQITLRAEPSEDAAGIGEITGTSQSVHVLENREDGWSLVECYSSSFHGSKSEAWNAFVTGYVKTLYLKTVTPDQHYGIVVDKLTQELYLFHDGHLMTTLAVSTGLANERQPYNETRSGEFMLVSKVGNMTSDNLIGAKAIRFNSGDLLHEVPYVKNGDGSKSFKNTEPKLGFRASHGCIRVQRLKNVDGINQTWLWDNLPVSETHGTKLVIWEDFAGRQMAIPDASTPVYYNPKGGTMYHSTANCPGVRSQYLPLTAFTYGELEDAAYSKLARCTHCFPPLRESQIEEINRIHMTASPGMITEQTKGEN